MLPRPTSHHPALGPGCAGPALAFPDTAALSPAELPRLQHPSCGAAPLAVDPAYLPSSGSHQHTQYPYVTGSSVLALTYKDGIMIASDTLGCYGSTKRYKSFDRLRKVNGTTIIGASGELSDFQAILTMLDELSTEDYCSDDGTHLTSKEIYTYLTEVLYNRRNKMDPLWNSLVIGGLCGGKPFLGTINMIGIHYTDSHIATGFGNHLARPLFREKHRPDMTEAEAEALLKEGLQVCYYRDKNSINKFQKAKVTAEGVTISDTFALETKWSHKAFENPSLHAVGTW